VFKSEAIAVYRKRRTNRFAARELRGFFNELSNSALEQKVREVARVVFNRDSELARRVSIREPSGQVNHAPRERFVAVNSRTVRLQYGEKPRYQFGFDLANHFGHERQNNAGQQKCFRVSRSKRGVLFWTT
jgi:hypothetical protein